MQLSPEVMPSMPSSGQRAESSCVVEIGGAVQRPLRLDVDALREFDSVSIAPFDLVCSRQAATLVRWDAIAVCCCARCSTRRACAVPTTPISSAAHGFSRARARRPRGDAWHELFNTPIGDQAISAYECADRELGVADGLPVLISGADNVHAPAPYERPRARRCRCAHSRTATRMNPTARAARAGRTSLCTRHRVVRAADRRASSMAICRYSASAAMPSRR